MLLNKIYRKQHKFLRRGMGKCSRTLTTLFMIISMCVYIGQVASCECECGCGIHCSYPRDCRDIQDTGFNISDTYLVYPVGVYTGIKVYCDMETDNGGWLVFQRREDGSINFHKGWIQYLFGFGDTAGEHWLGNQNIHLFTSQGAYELRIDLEDWDGNTVYSKYKVFQVGNRNQNYMLTIDGYTGDGGAANSMFNHHGYQFSSFNRDNDMDVKNCAETYSGGWWYNNCLQANLNGYYFKNGNVTGNESGIIWRRWKGPTYSLKRTEMKMRRV